MRRGLGSMSRMALGIVMMLGVCALAGCGSSSTRTSTTAPFAGIAPSAVRWCSTPTIAFEDDGTAPPSILPSWAQAKPLLGFTVELPPLIPKDACLVSGGGVVRNPTFGSRFTVLYALATTGALSIAEVPKSQDIPQPQCDAEQSGNAPIATCQQTINGLNVTISSSLTFDQVRYLLASLKPNVDWVPKS